MEYINFLKKVLPAIDAGHIDVVTKLVRQAPEWGKRPYGDEEGGETFLHRAARSGQTAVCKLFIDLGIDVNSEVKDDGHSTPLVYAAGEGHLDTVRWLLQHGAAVDGTARTVASPLITAALFNHIDVVQALVDARAEVNRLHLRESCTALDFADTYGHSAVSSLLRRSGGIRVANQKVDWSRERGGSIIAFVDSRVGPVLPIRLTQVVESGAVELRIARVAGRDKWRLLFTIGLFVQRPRIELALCVPAEWPLNGVAMTAESFWSFPLRVLLSLAHGVQKGTTVAEGFVVERAGGTPPESVWPRGLLQLIAVNHALGADESANNTTAMTDDSVTIYVLVPVYSKKVPAIAANRSRWLEKQRHAPWHRIALALPVAV